LIESNRYGLYHITNAGDCTWYQFATKIFEIAGLNADLFPTTSSEFKTVATRPGYSVLANTALTMIGLPVMRPWNAALQDYIHLRWG
jgi:dTDP-4-dehydrorhamnose reductase